MTAHPGELLPRAALLGSAATGSDEIDAQARLVTSSPIVRVLLEAMDGFLLVLNPDRRVLAASSDTLRALGVTETQLRGVLPGNLLQCVHATETPEGCGGSPHCVDCGARTNVVASLQRGRPSEGDFLLTARRDGRLESREFHVKCTPVRVEEADFTVALFRDVSAERRREALERVFFHDILNTLTGLLGWSRRLQMGEPTREVVNRVALLAERLAREIQDQRVLLDAERGELAVSVAETDPVEVLTLLRAVFSGHEALRDRHLVLEEPGCRRTVRTDATLLVRVLANMVRNALEAVPAGAEVRVGYDCPEGAPRFTVWNPGAMAPHVQLHVFQRSFSTKGGRGRGLGTWGMKLFGERYLGGKVGFTSTPEEGTTFSIELPAGGPRVA